MRHHVNDHINYRFHTSCSYNNQLLHNHLWSVKPDRKGFQLYSNHMPNLNFNKTDPDKINTDFSYGQKRRLAFSFVASCALRCTEKKAIKHPEYSAVLVSDSWFTGYECWVILPFIWLLSTLFVAAIMGVMTRMGSGGKVLVTVRDQRSERVDCMGRLHNRDFVGLQKEIDESLKKQHKRVMTLYISLS